MSEDDKIKHPGIWIIIIHIIMFIYAIIYASWQSIEVRTSVLTSLNTILGG